MAKQIDANSVRQQVVEVLYDHENGLKASQIVKILVQKGVDKKKVHIHSHLQAFKNQKTKIVDHNMESAIYRLTEAGRTKFEADRAELVQA